MVMPWRHISRVYEHYLRSRPPFEAFLTPSMRSFHIMRLDVGPFFTWKASTTCFEAWTTLLQGNVELLHQIGPSFCGTSPSHEGFMYMWHVLLVFDLVSFIVWMTSHLL
jgi:hypothetical protein